MKIKRLAVHNFGKLHDVTLDFYDGINLVCGQNESGKSTLHAFISAMFFGMERGRGRAAKNDAFTKYTPWDGGSYGGVIEIEKDGRTYSLSRNFSGVSARCLLTNETDSRDLAPTKENLSSILNGLTPSVYQNTISVGQLQAGTGDELSDELTNHIVNLHTAGSFSLDISGAVSSLATEKKHLLNAYDKNSDNEAAELKGRISSLEAELDADKDIPSLIAREQKIRDLSDNLKNAQDRSTYLFKSVSDHEAALRLHHINGEEDIEKAERIIGKTCKRAEAAAKKDDTLPDYSGTKTLCIILSIVFFIGLAVCLFMGYQALMRGEKELSYLLPYIAGAGVCFLAFIVFVVLAASAGRKKNAVDRFCKVYNRYMGMAPSNELYEVDALSDIPDNCREHFTKLSEEKEEIKTLSKNIKTYQAQLKKLDESMPDLRRRHFAIEQKETALVAVRQQLAALNPALEKNATIKEKCAAIDLAARTIEDLSKKNIESFGHFLEEKTSALIASMTDGAYSGVHINENFDVSLIQNMRHVALSSVSAGTLDQVYLALRIACIEFLWPDEPMPLLLDDTFAMYDDARLASTLDWLRTNYFGQVFILSCHKREDALLSELHIPYKRISIG